MFDLLGTIGNNQYFKQELLYITIICFQAKTPLKLKSAWNAKTQIRKRKRPQRSFPQIKIPTKVGWQFLLSHRMEFLTKISDGGCWDLSSQRNKAARRVNDTRFSAPLIIHISFRPPLWQEWSNARFHQERCGQTHSLRMSLIPEHIQWGKCVNCQLWEFSRVSALAAQKRAARISCQSTTILFDLATSWSVRSINTCCVLLITRSSNLYSNHTISTMEISIIIL